VRRPTPESVELALAPRVKVRALEMNQGSGTTPATPGQSVYVNHGLSVAPKAVALTPTGPQGGVYLYDVTSSRIYVRSTSASVPFHWVAWIGREG